MKHASPIAFLCALSYVSLFAGTEAVDPSPKSDFEVLANTGEKELRPLVVRVLTCDLKVKSMFVPFDPPGTYSFDRIAFEILGPAKYEGKKWSVFAVSRGSDEKGTDFIQPGAAVELDISFFGISKAGLLDLMGSQDQDDGVYLERKHLRQPNKRPEGTPGKSSPSKPSQVPGAPHP